jgi:hypothetical protein
LSPKTPSPEDLAHVEGVAALGYLLNAIAHDLNNQLTNLMLGADQAQYSGSKDAIDLMVQQAQNIASITRAVQRMGQRNMSQGSGRADLARVCRDFVEWYQASCEDAEVELHTEGDGPPVFGKDRNLILAFNLLSRSGDPEALKLPLSVHLATEAVPRSTWAGSTETVDMAVVRLRRGSPSREQTPAYRSLVDDFFAGDRSEVEVGIMAAWEILRKVRGRPSARMEVYEGGAQGHEVVVMLPLAD